MAYAAKLINRIAQHGRVYYDLVVEDDEGLLPPRRSSVGWPADVDIPERDAVLGGAAQAALDSLRDEEIDRNIQNALDQKDTTTDFSTVAENIAEVKKRYAQMSSWDAIRMGAYIASLGLTDPQITNLFGYAGAARVKFKNKIAAAAAAYAQVIAEEGGG